MKQIILITAIIAFASCKKTTNNYNTTNNNYYNSTNNYGTLIGSIQGIVGLFDQANNAIISPTTIAGDTIAITNNSTGVIYKTTTDATGTYLFSNLSAGTYSFTASKQSYGIVKAFGFEFVGGGITYKNFQLGQIPTTNVTTAQATVGTGITINGTAPYTSQTLYTNIYVSKPSNTFVNGTLDNYSSFFGTAYTGTTFSYNINTQTLYNLGFTSGSTVYFAVYMVGIRSVYSDPITGLTVYTALSNTPVFTSAIVP